MSAKELIFRTMFLLFTFFFLQCGKKKTSIKINNNYSNIALNYFKL
jgi:hypothetical protein